MSLRRCREILCIGPSLRRHSALFCSPSPLPVPSSYLGAGAGRAVCGRSTPRHLTMSAASAPPSSLSTSTTLRPVRNISPRFRSPVPQGFVSSGSGGRCLLDLPYQRLLGRRWPSPGPGLGHHPRRLFLRPASAPFWHPSVVISSGGLRQRRGCVPFPDPSPPHFFGWFAVI